MSDDLPPGSDPEQMTHEELASLGRRVLSKERAFGTLVAVAFGILIAPASWYLPPLTNTEVLIAASGGCIGFALGISYDATRLEEERTHARVKRWFKRRFAEVTDAE